MAASPAGGAVSPKKHMLVSVLLLCAVCLLLIASILFFPRLKLGKITLSTYWIVALFGAALFLATGQTDVVTVFRALTADNAVNPLKILVLFLSMTVLSVFLDELGFFRALASFALRHAHKGQTRLFFSLYLTVSVLTVFTSNDIIVLSFTPFICYFARKAKVRALPYLAAEFVAANTWSMALIIGNPTNIYLATAYGVDFVEYLKVTALPTLSAGMVALFALLLLFRKQLKEPLGGSAERVKTEDKPLLAVGVVHLAAATVLLALSSYLGFEMWYVALACAGSLAVVSLAVSLVRKKKPSALIGAVKRAPYPLVPFMLSMFVMIVGLEEHGFTGRVAALFGEQLPILKYGAASFCASNLINNIPMSVLFSSIIANAGGAALPAMYATVVGSNLGAFFTPIGALAGIMFGKIVTEHGESFGYLQFLKMGVFVAIPALAAALGVLALIV